MTLSDFLWSPSGQTLYFEGISQSVKNLWKVEVEPRSLRWTAGPERLTTGAGPDKDIAISPDGRKLAFTARAEKTRLWSLPFDASAGRIKGESRPVTAAGVKAGYPNCRRTAGRWRLLRAAPGNGSFGRSRSRMEVKRSWRPTNRIAHSRIGHTTARGLFIIAAASSTRKAPGMKVPCVNAVRRRR